MPNGRLIVEAQGNWAYDFWLGTQRVVRIGRGPMNDLRLRDSTVSTTHAEIAWDGETYTVRDLDSRNGVFVNEERVDIHDLASGDEIAMGNMKLTFFEGEDAPEPVVAPPMIEPDDDEPDYEQTAMIPGLDRITRIDQALRSGGLAGLDDPMSEVRQLREVVERIQGDLFRMEREVEVRTQRQSLARLLGSSESEGRRLRAAVDFIVSQLQAENGFLVVVDRRTGKWVLRARSGGIRDWTPGQLPTPICFSIVERALRDGEPIFSENLAADDRFQNSKSAAELQILAAMCAPLRRDGQNVGCLYVDRRIHAGDFSTEARELFRVFADGLVEAMPPASPSGPGGPGGSCASLERPDAPSVPAGGPCASLERPDAPSVPAGEAGSGPTEDA